MRMWMINPKLLCNKHLFGEHVECHMFVCAIMQNVNLNEYISNNLLEISSLRRRHDDLAKEIINRGFVHDSLLPIISWKCVAEKYGDAFYKKIHGADAFSELMIKCDDCSKRAEAVIGEDMKKTKQLTLDDFGLEMKTKKKE